MEFHFTTPDKNFGKATDADPWLEFTGGRWDGAKLILRGWSSPLPPPQVALDDETGEVIDTSTQKSLGFVS